MHLHIAFTHSSVELAELLIDKGGGIHETYLQGRNCLLLANYFGVGWCSVVFAFPIPLFLCQLSSSSFLSDYLNNGTNVHIFSSYVVVIDTVTIRKSHC